MKRLFILTVIAAMFFAACSESTETPKQNEGDGIPAENMGFIVKHTGTKCPPCGGWGWTLFAELIDATKENAVHLSAYSQNSFAQYLISPEATALMQVSGLTGFPTFEANDMNQAASPRSSTVEKQNCLDAVTAHNGAEVEMNAVITYKIVDGKIIIDYKLKAFKDMPEANEFAIYILENKVKASQSGHPDGVNAIHKHVLRKGVNGAWGLEIGPMKKGDIKTGTEEVEIGMDNSTNMTWAEENIEVIGVMRYNKNTVHMFVNACRGTIKI